MIKQIEKNWHKNEHAEIKKHDYNNLTLIKLTETDKKLYWLTLSMQNWLHRLNKSEIDTDWNWHKLKLTQIEIDKNLVDTKMKLTQRNWHKLKLT